MEYTPYGESWVDEGTNKNVIGYRFTSKELDGETGLYYFGARYLDPLTSRWISPDPAMEKYLPERQRNRQLPGQGGVFNPINLDVYHYAGNNPIKYVDPDGKWFGIDDAFTGPVDEIIVIGGLSAAAALGSPWAKEQLHKLGETLDKIFANQDNDEAWDKTEEGDTVVVDKSGNAVRVKKGQKVEGNPEGDIYQVKDKNGNPTGDRVDGKGHPKQKDPKAQEPHGHRVKPNGEKVTDENGNPHLPLKKAE